MGSIRRLLISCWIVIGTVTVVACSSGEGGSASRVPGNARFYNGPTPASAFAPEGQTAAAADGRWLVTPTQVRFTVRQLIFQTIDAGGITGGFTADLGMACIVTWDKSQPTLSTTLDCPFTADTGSYNQLAVLIDPEVDVLIDDPAAGIFTDPTSPSLLSTTAPATGAAFVAYAFTPPEGDLVNAGNTYLFPSFVVDSSDPVEVEIASSAIHEFVVDVVGASASFSFGVTPQLHISVQGLAKASFYSSSATIESVNINISPPQAEFLFYYDTPDTPSFVFGVGPAACYASGPSEGLPHGANNTSPEASPVFTNDQRLGGYLGLDSAGTLCWAIPHDATYSAYESIFAIPEVATLGSSATMTCEARTTAPAPLEGLNYSSGCPTVTPSAQIGVTLVAH